MKFANLTLVFFMMISTCCTASLAAQQGVDAGNHPKKTSTSSDDQIDPRSFANVRLPPFGARGDGRTDDTAAIQAAIDSSERVYLPKGVYLINPQIGLHIRTGTQLIGSGRSSSILIAGPGGGSLSQLANYGPGSIIRRRFAPNNRNPYIAYVRLADLSIVLTHPQKTITSDKIQIGIDFRNVSRSIIERVHVGNSLPIDASIHRTASHVYDSQGYGIVLGTVPSSLIDYSGGELNVIRDSNVWGAFKAIVLDDEILSPRSAAHGTIIEYTDIQGAQTLLSQESIYTRSVTFRNNTLQNVVPQPAGNDQATVLRIDGQDIRVDGGYVEAGGLANYLIRLGPFSKNLIVSLQHISCTNKPITLDQGNENSISYRVDCPTIVRRAP
ncbi:glycosyl hydrolase family 28-related protein [Sphingomonas sp. C3-2]|uniref:glycosyl hydrolase family 28-related protein n=1 Tax=Sphingomonas sp. C3-2 TaxID=3062169 RepID=UPI00294B3D70|nr:glycosyl hydrolase family 28-related protein [Sphingomonas sp. C3-2]WOK35112.1 glycosyl hydrolase family 28-related protein [Sphingomonas sp. C3-2]